MEQKLNDRWQRGLKRAATYSRIVKTRIFLAFVILPIQLIFATPSFFESVMGVVLFFVVLAVYGAGLAIFWKGLKQYDHIGSRPSLKTPSEATLLELNKILLPLTDAMGIAQSRLNLLVDYKNFAPGPSVIESRKSEQAYVLIPLGYLKMLKGDPKIAEAIMAHELSHLCQGDTRLWLLVTAFGRTMLRVFIPFSALSFVAFWIFVASSLGFDNEWPMTVKTTLVQLFGGVAVQLAFYYSVTKMRRKSEEIADLGAAAFAGIDNVKKALSPYIDHDSSSPFSLHPSARERADALTKLENASV